MGIIAIDIKDEWARHLKELSRQAASEGTKLSGRITIETDGDVIVVEL